MRPGTVCLSKCATDSQYLRGQSLLVNSAQCCRVTAAQVDEGWVSLQNANWMPLFVSMPLPQYPPFCLLLTAASVLCLFVAEVSVLSVGAVLAGLSAIVLAHVHGDEETTASCTRRNSHAESLVPPS